MSTSVVSVRLPAPVKDRLDALAASTGRTVTFYVQEAVEAHLDDLEYAYILQGEAEAIRRGDMATVSAADVAAELGLQE